MNFNKLFKLKRFGRRTAVPKESDPSSEQNILEEKIKKVGPHLDDRFSRYIRLGGQVHYISKKTGVPPDQIVRPGRSLYQDQTSGMGNNFHAAHIIRVGEISNEIDESYSTFLKGFVGHTQIVPSSANLGIGQDIDEIQTDNLTKLFEINFDRQNEEDDAIIEEIRVAFLSVLTKRINKEEPESRMKIALKDAFEKISAWSVDELYAKVKRGVERIQKNCEP